MWQRITCNANGEVPRRPLFLTVSWSHRDYKVSEVAKGISVISIEKSCITDCISNASYHLWNGQKFCDSNEQVCFSSMISQLWSSITCNANREVPFSEITRDYQQCHWKILFSQIMSQKWPRTISDYNRKVCYYLLCLKYLCIFQEQLVINCEMARDTVMAMKRSAMPIEQFKFANYISEVAKD